MAIGSFCLVLHGHVPYVLRHGLWPHGEDWLYEAAAETYLPLLAMLDECIFLGARPHIAVGLTPVLLEQLAHDDFKDGLDKYLQDRIDRARADHREFTSMGNSRMAQLATRWINWYAKRVEQFRLIDRNIPKAFARRAGEGTIEVLTSAATHGYLPLLHEDSSIRAQIRAGLASSQRVLGFKPSGFWLPECAYRRGGPWKPPIAWAGCDNRLAIEHMLADESLTHCFVEHHLVEQSNSEFVLNGGHWHRVGWDEAAKYPGRGWRSVHESQGLNSEASGPARVTAFARDPRICEQVWSGWVGYPAHPSYLEFHKKWGPKRGLRYWKVTGKNVDLGQKHLYEPDAIQGRIFEHARHFCDFVKGRLREHRDRTGRHGVAVAAFDAELFGHWWFEGPQFLRDVILTLNADPDVDLVTPAMHMKDFPTDKTVSMPNGSWGEGGDDRVWANDKVNWMWEIEYRCEALLGKLTFELPWRKRAEIREILQKAGREMLLAQASDWPFMISRGQAVDYGIKRFMQHVSRFECLADIAEKLVGDSKYLGKLTEVERSEIRDADVHDPVFANVDLNWWNM
ncbi:MAG: 1,4-alpha-glucan branching protein domain-containing protein [Phycisphaerae bacterium]